MVTEEVQEEKATPQTTRGLRNCRIIFRAQGPSSDAIEQTSTEHAITYSYSAKNDTRSSVSGTCTFYTKEGTNGKQVVTEEVQEERKEGER